MLKQRVLSMIFSIPSPTCLDFKVCKCISWEDSKAEMFHLQRAECFGKL